MACAVLIEFVDPALPCAATAAANAARWRAEAAPGEPEIASDPAMLARYAGVYVRPTGGEVSIDLDQGRIFWHSAAGRLPLTQVAPHRFVLKADNRIMVFVLDAQGRVTQIDITYPGDTTPYVVRRTR